MKESDPSSELRPLREEELRFFRTLETSKLISELFISLSARIGSIGLKYDISSGEFAADFEEGSLVSISRRVTIFSRVSKVGTSFSKICPSLIRMKYGNVLT